MVDAKPQRRVRGGRWGLLATALAASAALVLAAWSSRARVVEATRTLERGQAQAFVTRARARLFEGDAAPEAADLETLLGEEKASGLRYLAVVQLDGEVVAAAGDAAAPIVLDRPVEDVSLVEVPGAVRAIVMPHRPPPGHDPGPPGARPPPPGEGPPLGPPPEERGPPGDPPPFGPPPHDGRPPPSEGRPPPPPFETALVLDFEPIVADALEVGATRTLLASTAAAAALMAAALVFWWQLGERDKARERQERERRLAALGEMSAVLAHEIKNPLTALKGHAQLLVEQLESGSREHKKAERIVASARRLEDLSSTLLDFVRSAELARERVDVAALLGRVAEEIAPGKVDLAIDAAPAEWRLDPLRIEQVLGNLIRNALEVSPADATITVGASVADRRLVLSVRDRGPGVPPSELETIFEPFHTTRTRGTGLGLAVARRIVEMHGGVLTAENHAEGGALFRAVIPG